MPRNNKRIGTNAPISKSSISLPEIGHRMRKIPTMYGGGLEEKPCWCTVIANSKRALTYTVKFEGWCRGIETFKAV